MLDFSAMDRDQMMVTAIQTTGGINDTLRGLFVEIVITWILGFYLRE